jgi:hypothetical protein
MNVSSSDGSDSSSPTPLDVVNGIAYSNTSALAASVAQATIGRLGNNLAPCPSPVVFDVQVSPWTAVKSRKFTQY